MSRWLRLALSFVVAPIIVAATADAAAAQPSEATLVGTEWLGQRPAAGAPALDVRRPIYQGRGAMVVEQLAAQRVIRGWWPASIAEAQAAAIIDGFASYLAAQAVEREFDLRYRRSAHSVESRAYLGDHIVWSFPTLRLSRHVVATRDRYGALFEALERWIGTPALQGAMYQVAQLPEDRLTATGITRTISDAVGQDLAWLFDAARSDVSYAVHDVTPTSVTVTRRAGGTFTGRSAARVGAFDSGDAVRLKVVFDDDSTAWASWDGRDQLRTFQFQAPSAVKAAYLDPDGLVTFDRNRLDNAIVPARPTNVPVRKWVARWVVWLQHTMLSYGSLA
jgi:hypothetical protein